MLVVRLAVHGLHDALSRRVSFERGFEAMFSAGVTLYVTHPFDEIERQEWRNNLGQNEFILNDNLPVSCKLDSRA